MSSEHDPSGKFVLDLETEHQVKNQISVIVGFSELLLASIPPADGRREDVEEIHRAAKALMHIFRDEARRL